MAERLDMLNTERRDIEAAVRAAALEQASERGFDARWSGPRARAGIPAWSASLPLA